MNLCIFVENYLKGGLDTFIDNLVNNFPKDAHITLICNKNHTNLEYLRNAVHAKVEVVEYSFFTNSILAWRFRTRSHKIIIYLVQFIEYFLRYNILMPIYLLRLILKFKQYQFESLLVVNGGYPGGIVARIACIAFKFANKHGRCVLNIHNDVIKARSAVTFHEYLLDKLVQKSVDLIIFPSEATRGTLINRPQLLKLPNQVVHNGIRNRCLKTALASKQSRKKIVMAGTLEERKGHSFALEALALLVKDVPDVKLHIFGEGTVAQEESIKRKIHELCLQKNVYLKGFNNNVLDEFVAATAVIMPSQEAEAFGLVLIEAMSVATPVICTNVGGMPEVVQQGHAGIVVEKQDVTAMANGLRKLILDSEYARLLGENGMKLQQEKFDVKLMSQQYHDLLRRC